jgi:hypothetical protein
MDEQKTILLCEQALDRYYNLQARWIENLGHVNENLVNRAYTRYLYYVEVLRQLGVEEERIPF